MVNVTFIKGYKCGYCGTIHDKLEDAKRCCHLITSVYVGKSKPNNQPML